MTDQKILLKHVTRDDVKRITTWLSNESVAESWFGRYSYGDPAHLGYHPEKVDSLSIEEWDSIFENPEHRIFSIYTETNEHIGEIHITIEESLGDAQISILIGDKDHWHKGYGTATLRATLDISFNSYGLFRVWADIPDYNEAAKSLFEHIGFVHEGTLRKSRPHDGVRHDSIIMGMLSTEFENNSI